MDSWRHRLAPPFLSSSQSLSLLLYYSTPACHTLVLCFYLVLFPLSSFRLGNSISSPPLSPRFSLLSVAFILLLLLLSLALRPPQYHICPPNCLPPRISRKDFRILVSGQTIPRVCLRGGHLLYLPRA